MRKILLSALLACSAPALTSPAEAVVHVLDFEDIDGDNVKIADGYRGLTWNNAFLTYDRAASPFSAHSGATVAYFNYIDGGMTPGFSYTRSIQFAADVIFQGAWFAGNFSGVQFSFYNDGQLLGTSDFLAVDATSRFLAGYSGAVDEVRITGSAGNFVMDDFAFDTEVSAAPVPEPATWAMMLAGFGAIGLALRRRGSRGAAAVLR